MEKAGNPCLLKEGVLTEKQTHKLAGMADWSTESLKNELLQRLRTDNPFLNLVLSSVVFFVFTTLLNNTHLFKWRTCWTYLNFRIVRVRKLCVSGRICKGGRYLDICWDFSLYFKAITHHLTTLPDGWSRMHSLHEIPSVLAARHETDRTDFIGIDGSVTQLSHGIRCKTLVSKEVRTCERSVEITENTTISYELSSKTLDLKGLRAFVAGCVEEYEAHKDRELNSMQHYFVYEGRQGANCLDFMQGEFNTNKTFDNTFFEGSCALKQRVMDFEDGEMAYKHLGLPYTLGVLLHGAPGTGVLLFIHVLCWWCFQLLKDSLHVQAKHQSLKLLPV